MALIIIVVALALQLAGYVLIDKYGFAWWLKLCILMVALLCHVWLFPMMVIFWETPADAGPRCGMPALGVTLVFWFLGALPTLLMFGIYEILQRRRQKRRAQESVN